MNGGTYLLILVIGAVVVLVDGQMIMRKAPEYLDEVYQNPGRSRKVTGMVVGLFHLIMLGVVALVSSVGLDPNAGMQSVLARIGVLLLLTAVGHGIAMVVLSRLREQELATQVTEMEVHRRDEHYHAKHPGHEH
ncbi:MAG: hypothetical protein M3Z25_01520 [Actinomycetota bacterium]|nr:hypothetical protein [Actinomycetota bacterium]